MANPQRILILFAHPALQKSRVNALLAAAARPVPGVTFHDLYEAYPDFDIDVAREQKLLLDHDVIVFQHPFYWYSCPALLKFVIAVPEKLATSCWLGADIVSFVVGDGPSNQRAPLYEQPPPTSNPGRPLTQPRP